jgi:hypothetical protein
MDPGSWPRERVRAMPQYKLRNACLASRRVVCPRSGRAVARAGVPITVILISMMEAMDIFGTF